jgi:antitoxin MazE
MTSAVVTLKRWGDGLGVELPEAVVRAADLHAGQRVSVTVEGKRVAIVPLRNELPTLEQRLALYDAECSGDEVMAADNAQGAERCERHQILGAPLAG